MGKRLNILEWSCHQTGDCCRAVSGVVMTVEEVEALRPSVPLDLWATLMWKPGPPSTVGRFVELVANPCPLLSTDGKCTIHPVRPYNCRRFACLRVDTSTPMIPDHEAFGCRNTRDLVNSSRPARRFMQHLQQKAQRWAVTHGWKG